MQNRSLEASENTASYFLQNGYSEVKGWLQTPVLYAVDCCAEILRNNAHCWEHTLEIGVHEGKFFIPLERITPDDKHAFALDIFDLQMFNIDRSGCGNLESFQDNVSRYCRIPQRVRVEKRDSFDIYGSPLADLSFSFVSVDGGHTPDHAFFDLQFASEHLQPGGIIILDDFPNSHWLGVLEGATLFFAKKGRRIAPFATGNNKLLSPLQAAKKSILRRFVPSRLVSI